MDQQYQTGFTVVANCSSPLANNLPSGDGRQPGIRGAWVLVVVLLGLFTASMPARAATSLITTASQGLSCIPERVNSSVNCTANDFTVGATFSASPGTPPFCVAGQSFEFLVDLDLTSNSPDRYDVGFFVGENGNRPDTSSTGDKCSVATFPTTPSPFYKANENTCGDYQGPGQQSITRINKINVTCQGDAAGALAIPYTLVYSQNVGDTLSCAGPANVVPGTKSKCQSGTNAVSGAVAVDVGAYIDVTKRTVPTGSSQSFSFTASVPSGVRIIAQTAGVGTATSSDDTYSSPQLSNASNTVTVNIADGQTVRFLTTAKSTATPVTIVEQAASGWSPATAISCNSVRGTTPFTINNTTRTLTASLDSTNSASTCTFTNTRQRNLTLAKRWLNARINDAANITASGLTSLAAVANTANETDTAAPQVANVGSSITLAETFTTGNAAHYTTSTSCSTAAGTAVALTNGQFTMPDADVTCTYSNSRIAQPLNLAKTWQNGGSGHTAAVTTTGGINNATLSSTSSGSNSATGSAVTVYAGDVISLPAETFGGGATAAQYNSSLACSGGTTLASGAVARSITISNSTTATVCTYTNVRKSATLTLRKSWTNAALNDAANVTASGLTSLAAVANTANETDTGSAQTVYAGDSITLGETFTTDIASNYNATLACSGNSTALSGNTLTVGNSDTAISCTYTNSRKTASVTLRKVWSGAATSDTATLSLKRAGSPVDSLSSTAAAASQTNTDSTPFTAYVGESLNLSETLGSSNAGQYVASLSCDNGVTISATGDFSMPASATICTVTNTRKTRTVTLNKSLSPTLDAGKFNLIINGSTVATNVGNGGTGNITVPVGSSVSISETAGTGTVLANYTSSLSCTGISGVTGTTSASFTQPDANVVCTFGNTRKSATLTLVKQWQNGKSGDAVSIPATTGLTNNTAVLNSTSSGSNSTTGSAVMVYAGETATLGNESFTTGSAANYNSSLSCSGATDTNPADGLSINATDTAITCTYTNTINSADLVISKTGPASAIQGSTVTYTIQVWNRGPSIVTASTLTDRVPAGLTGVTWTCTASGSATCGSSNGTGNNISVSTGTLPVNNTATPPLSGSYLTYQVSGTASATGNIINIASSSNPVGAIETDSSNNSSSASTRITAATIGISGQVFEDNSGTTAINSNAYNAVKDSGEAGIVGSSVSITNCNSTTVATSTSNANGEYSLSLAPAQVPAGSFCIAQTNLSGYASVSGTAGYNRATDSITVSNSGASNYSNHDFGDARINALLSEDGQQTIAAGGVAEYPHRLTAQTVLTINSLNQTSSQQPASTTEQNWQAMIYRDSNCNGRVDSGESLLSQSLPLTLKNAEEVCLVQRVYAPATASMGAQHIGQLQASFSVTLADASQITGSSLQRQDTTLLGSAGLSMQKGVRSVASCPSSAADTAGFKVQNQAQSGSYLEYEITYRNNSSRNLVNVSIKDSVPTGTVYQSTACISTPSGSCNASHLNGALLWQTGGTLLPSQQGTVRFCVQVP